jgi:hypothetical protein
MVQSNPYQAQYAVTDLVPAATLTGTEVAEFVQGGQSVQVSVNQIVAAVGLLTSAIMVTPANPSGTTSLTGVMMGLGGVCSITPAKTGRVLVLFTGNQLSSSASDGAASQIRFGTGSAPANGAALTGTTAGNPVATNSVTGPTQSNPFSNVALLSGLTLNTAYWIDLAVNAITGGTATPQSLTFVAIEV